MPWLLPQFHNRRLLHSSFARERCKHRDNQIWVLEAMIWKWMWNDINVHCILVWNTTRIQRTGQKTPMKILQDNSLGVIQHPNPSFFKVFTQLFFPLAFLSLYIRVLVWPTNGKKGLYRLLTDLSLFNTHSVWYIKNWEINISLILSPALKLNVQAVSF